MRKSLFLFVLSLALIFTLLVALFFYGYKVHRTSAHRLLNATDTLMLENPGIHLMDSALFVLNDAESNFRLYTVMYNRQHLASFSSELGTVLSLVDSISHSFATSGPDAHFDSLIQQKQDISGRIGDLKKTTDAMLAGTLKNDLLERLLNGIRRYKVNQVKKEKVTMDTVNTAQPQAQVAKKGLFKRLGNALSNKKNSDTIKSQVKILVKTKDGRVIDKEKYDAEQLKNVVTGVNDYYKNMLRKQLANRLQINQQESALVTTNVAMMNEMKQLLISLRSFAEKQGREKKSMAHGIVAGSAQQMISIVWFGLIALLLCLAAIAGAAWFIRKNNRLLKQGKLLAEEQTRIRTDFLNNMSHEMRTPLNSVAGFTEQLTFTQLTGEQQRIVHSIETSTNMLIQVVNDVLDFSKLEQDYIPLTLQHFMPYQVFNEVADMMRIQAMKKHLEFNVSFEGDKNGQANGDVFRLKQIMLNLISNAVKYTDKGTITLSATLGPQDDKHWLFEMQVTDTGEGISAAAQQHLFERFYQTDSARRKGKGTGLGLAITKRLVTMQGGDISVSSEEDKGTTFVFRVPYERVEVPLMVSNNMKDVSEATGATMEGRYVLAADDQEMNLLLLKMILTRWKCRFDMATNGVSALELFRQYRYDLVLLDLQMPEMSGLEVIEAIRKDSDPEKAAVKVFALTGNINPEDEIRFKKAGFNGWLLKPFREKDIYKVIIESPGMSTK
ncbi:phospho-acceptor domain-containing protein [Chitinophaga dinghuensis]|uniref:histidine kinase n=1 Tax=Chitinophaga dinghuensis TaxID=1539050 RepID=A0A327VKV6_9BACT|nr:ATP-binding protein [Chitinophaga dinghuensis]RAJ73917.1 phospho-acceptor domain-containing protein [Chitinophaga dinghuensis]